MRGVDFRDVCASRPADDRERVFDRFHRLAQTDTTGSGLGLAIVREIAQRHGAAVELGDGPEGRGLRVTLRFPRKENV